MAQAPKQDAMTPTQKLAALMILLGEDTAAAMLKSFDDNERELVCAEMANLPMMDQEQQGIVLQEFTEMAIAASSGVTGSVDYTRKVLEKSVGLFKAAEIIGRVGTARTSVSTMQQIIDLDAIAISGPWCSVVRGRTVRWYARSGQPVAKVPTRVSGPAQHRHWRGH